MEIDGSAIFDDDANFSAVSSGGVLYRQSWVAVEVDQYIMSFLNNF